MAYCDTDGILRDMRACSRSNLAHPARSCKAVQHTGKKVRRSVHFQHTACQSITLPAPGRTATASKNAGLPRWSCCWQLDFWRRSCCAASTSGAPRPSAASLLRRGTGAGAVGVC